MTTYIDLNSLGPTEELAKRRMEAWGLKGETMDQPDAVLLTAGAGDQVVCQPSAFPYWRKLPASVPIIYAADTAVQDDLKNRVDEWMVWALTLEGLGVGEARALVRQPPKTEKHGKWEAWRRATELAAVYQSMAKGSRGDTAAAGPLSTSGVLATGQTWELVTAPDGTMKGSAIVALEDALERDAPNALLGIDVETEVVGKEPNETKDILVGVGLAVGGGTFYGEASNPTWMKLLELYLHRFSWIGHNAAYDLCVMRRHGIEPGPLAGDGMLAARLLGEPTAGLKDIVERRYGIQMTTYDQVTGGGKRSIKDVPPEETAPYCCADAALGVMVERDLRGQLTGQALKLYEDIDIPLVKVVVNMELRGIGLDIEGAREALNLTYERLLALAGAIDALAKASGFRLEDKRTVCKGCRNGKKKKLECPECMGAGEYFTPTPFNPGSRDQLVAWLHDHLSIPIQGLTPKRQPSVDALALLKMEKGHPTVPLILAWRRDEKYREFLEEWVKGAEESEDGRIHADVTMAAVASGRFSYRTPNLQQVHAPWRKHFRPQEGSSLLAVDYDQLEVRIAAFSSRDEALLKVVNDPDGDIHGENMEKLFRVPKEEWKTNVPLRTRAKNYMFGSLYGSHGPQVLVVLQKEVLKDPSLGEPPTLKEIAKGIRGIHDAYPHYFREWRPYMLELCRERGNTSYTAFGRPRVLPELTSFNKEQREAAERAAINHIIQGTAADIARAACLRVEAIEGGRLLVQIHDELLCEVRDDMLAEYERSMVELMCLGQPLDGVPLTVSAKSGKTWAECK